LLAGQDSYFWVKSYCKSENWELISWQLFEAGAPAVEELDLDEQNNQHFKVSSDSKPVLDALIAALPTFEWEQGEGENVDWDLQWKNQQTPVKLTSRFTVSPPWLDSSESEATHLKIEAKMAFGTGEHESTRLCIHLLEEIEGGIKQVLDIGTGTGILLMVAKHLGAEEMWYTEIDPVTLPCIIENFPLNGMEVPWGLLGPVEALNPANKFNTIISNMIRSEVWPMKEQILERLEANANWILSGQLIDQDKPVWTKWFDSVGIEILSEQTEGDWWSCRVTKK
jgi:ribosomal protein L11 methyltransferase